MKQENEKKIILSLCGGTGSWEAPYRKYPDIYDVRNITLPDYDILQTIINKNHICFGTKEKWDTKGVECIFKENVYGILAAPPCTMFSFARTNAKKPRDFRQGMELVIACLKIIWECRYKNKLAFWVLENPMGYLRQFLGKPIFTFDPCDFGDRYTKKTDLWGYFNKPKKKPIKLTKEELARCKINNRKLPSISEITGSKQADRRAITPKGFAEAFFRANQ
jgi:site-specific DNA-cytosine methylase